VRTKLELKDRFAISYGALIVAEEFNFSSNAATITAMSTS
jgi:hypothetical protein